MHHRRPWLATEIRGPTRDQGGGLGDDSFLIRRSQFDFDLAWNQR